MSKIFTVLATPDAKPGTAQRITELVAGGFLRWGADGQAIYTDLGEQNHAAVMAHVLDLPVIGAE